MHQLENTNAIRRLESLLAVEREERACLQEELDLRNCALDSARTHFMMIDIRRPRWTIMYANRAIAQDHGYKDSELVGRSPAALVPVEANPDAFQRIGEAVRVGNTASAEVLAHARTRC